MMGVSSHFCGLDNAHVLPMFRHDCERVLLLSGSITVTKWSCVMLMFCEIVSARQENTKAQLMMPGQLLGIRGLLALFQCGTLRYTETQTVRICCMCRDHWVKAASA